MLGGKPRNFVRTKLRPPGCVRIIAKAAIMRQEIAAGNFLAWF
jgi:hypothetical protein